jgi:hypothetical protein
MSQHTPGPWTVKPGHAFGSRNVYGPRKAHVAEVWNGSTRDPAEAEAVAEANARLIAAAPKMLEALKAALERMESDWQVIEGEFGPGYGAAKKRKMCDIDAAIAAKEPTVEEIIAVRAAIAEAEGRS